MPTASLGHRWPFWYVEPITSLPFGNLVEPDLKQIRPCRLKALLLRARLVIYLIHEL